MSEQYIKGAWKVKGKKVAKASSPMIGCIYRADNIVGVFTEDLGELVVLRTSEQEEVKVLKKHLKIVVTP